MKPFNLEAALRGDPVVTAGGNKVLRLAYLPEADSHCRVVAVIEGRPGVWVFSVDGVYYTSISEMNLRMAERTFTLGGMEVPSPESKPLQEGQRYYYPNVGLSSGYNTYTWEDHYMDRRHLEQGLVHLNPEAAITHVKALISVNKAALNGEQP